jgi:hypothetical protein
VDDHQRPNTDAEDEEIALERFREADNVDDEDAT